jgi:hypothetical protein
MLMEFHCEHVLMKSSIKWTSGLRIATAYRRQYIRAFIGCCRPMLRAETWCFAARRGMRSERSQARMALQVFLPCDAATVRRFRRGAPRRG